MANISKGAALRLAGAARVLSEDDPAGFVVAIGSRLGLPINEDRLQSLTMEDLRGLLTANDGSLPEQCHPENLKSALRYLWGEQNAQEPPPALETLPESMRDQPTLMVAVASNRGVMLDGHFGSCLRFLIYKVSQQGFYLHKIEDVSQLNSGLDRNDHRAARLKGCHLLCVQSIGGPAAAKVIKQSVHPVRFPLPVEASEALQKIQQNLDAPPPWLARELGQTTPLRDRLTVGADT